MTADKNRIERLEKTVQSLKRQVAALLPAENLSEYKNAREIKASFKAAQKLYPAHE